jgi:hypothetical protein
MFGNLWFLWDLLVQKVRRYLTQVSLSHTERDATKVVFGLGDCNVIITQRNRFPFYAYVRLVVWT